MVQVWYIKSLTSHSTQYRSFRRWYKNQQQSNTYLTTTTVTATNISAEGNLKKQVFISLRMCQQAVVVIFRRYLRLNHVLRKKLLETERSFFSYINCLFIYLFILPLPIQIVQRTCCLPSVLPSYLCMLAVLNAKLHNLVGESIIGREFFLGINHPRHMATDPQRAQFSHNTSVI